MTKTGHYIEGLRCRGCGKDLPPRRNDAAARDGRVYCSRSCMYDYHSRVRRLMLILLSAVGHRPIGTRTCALCGTTYYRMQGHNCQPDGRARKSSYWTVVNRCAVCGATVLAPNPAHHNNRCRASSSRLLSRPYWRWQCGHESYYDAVRRDPMAAEWPE